MGLGRNRLLFRGVIFFALQSFLSLVSRPICLSPAREIGGLRVAGVVVSCLVSCIGHILVAMS